MSVNSPIATPLAKWLATLCLSVLCFCVSYRAQAQPGAEIEVQKPTKYENRKLGAEKTGEKKFTIPRRLYQNTVTHYNYYFNANNRLNEVVRMAKQSFKDDYSQLLPFYNYTLATTAQNAGDLDSVIYKCTAGILLHDLRNSWIDNMYLLLAKAYFFRNDLDSAQLTLQYVNFSFAPKEEGNYDIPIGSNASNDEGEFSISTKEKKSVLTKLTSRPPSRNESFIWQIRTLIEKNELPEASGLIEILRHDPNFPGRLHTDLEEVLAYWFYKQQVYDSAAVHLEGALDNAKNSQEKARWEYLIAQMYQLTGKYEDAVNFYNKSITHTTDPVLDVYARLNSIRIQKTDKKDYLQQNIDALHKMAKRDKYENYRDIIYYAAADIELQRQGYDNARKDLLNSVKYSINNPQQRSQSFLLLGDLSYNQSLFVEARNNYDSLDVNLLATEKDKDRVGARKPPLAIIADNILLVNKQDSVQALAKLSPAERDAYLKKMVKQLRKAQGLKEEEGAPSNNPAVQQQTNLFSNTEKTTDFYFYNASSKARGFSEFKARWGERPNVDNWRRKSAVDRQLQKIGDVDDVPSVEVAAGEQKALKNSYEGLLQDIPLTEDKLQASDKSIERALFENGLTFMNKLEEYPAAITAFEELLRRFPDTDRKEETWFDLVYAYEKTGDMAKADAYKQLLTTKAADSKWSKLVNQKGTGKEDNKDQVATKKYEDIYTLFIEGRFAEAIAQKQMADSTYGNNYWTPQLLYIEAIYDIKQQNDSAAIGVLTELDGKFSGNVMAERARTMIDVLKRRKEIESYLTNLKVTREEDDDMVRSEPPAAKPVADTVRRINVPTGTEKAKTDTVAKTTPAPVVKKNVPDTAAMTVGKPKPEKPQPVKKDTVAAPPVVVKHYSFVAADSQYVVVVLDKVDPVYASEAKNAYNRFNRERFYNQKIDINSVKIDDRFSLVLQGPFANSDAAVNYIDQVKPVTKSRIVPWLPAEKLSYLIISQSNLEVLQNTKDMSAYQQLLQKALPGKF